MHIDISDQREGDLPIIQIDRDLVEAYLGVAGVDLSGSGVVKIRIRKGRAGDPYGFTQPTKDGYRIVINIRYHKLYLSEAASYVVSNTLLHEIRHVAQFQQKGLSVSPQYDGVDEVEAREFGRLIKGQTEMYAVR